MHLIDLDVASFDIFDLPPLNEYELYIKNFGRTDTRQVIISVFSIVRIITYLVWFVCKKKNGSNSISGKIIHLLQFRSALQI